MNKGILQITEIEEITIPNLLKDKMKNLIENELKLFNNHRNIFFKWLNCLIENSNSDMKNLLYDKNSELWCAAYSY